MTFVFKHPSKYKKEKLENQKDKPIQQKNIQVNVERLKHLGLIKVKENESINKISK